MTFLKSSSENKFFNFSLFLLAGLLISCSNEVDKTATYEVFKPNKFVDPFIGTGGHGHVYPGATVPFGMVHLSPDNGTSGWDWCSGYHYSDSLVA